MTDNLIPSFVGPEGIERYQSPKNYYLALDVETTNLERGSALNDENRLVLACWELVYPDGGVFKRHKWGDEYEMAELEEDIRGADFVVAHNAKFELQWLKRCGLELRDILVYDTMLAEWVIAGNRKWDISLDGTARRYGLGQKLSLAAAAIYVGICPSVIPQEWLLPYCYKDVELCRKLYEAQKGILERDDLFHLVLTRNLTCAVLADIEFNGAELDSEAVLREYEKTLNDFRQIESDLEQYAQGVNLSSPKQLASFLFEKLGFKVPTDHKGNPLKTSAGTPKTDVKTLALLKPDNEEQTQFLKMYKSRNKYDSLISKNLDFFRLIVQQKGSKFRAIFNQGFTQTHRLSSSGRPILFEGEKAPKGVQFQNLPRGYKRLFTAHRSDYLVGEADGAQLEFRVAADEGHDDVAEKEIVEGADVHSDTARVMLDNNHPDFVGLSIKDARQPAKPHTFAPLFGSQGKHKAEKEYVKFFRNKYQGIAKTQESWTYQVLDSGMLVTPYGMRFYWPGTRISRGGYIDNTTSIYNYPIQGFATGEIIPIALIHFWHRSRSSTIEIWNTIHDSVAARFHKDDADLYREISKQSLTHDVYNFLRAVYNYEFHVPLGVGVKIGTHWGQSEFEEIWSVWPNGKETYTKKE
jgi:DNA polymerase I-like protein with 3'-5' exonuclease and polymerase domains